MARKSKLSPIEWLFINILLLIIAIAFGTAIAFLVFGIEMTAGRRDEHRHKFLNIWFIVAGAGNIIFFCLLLWRFFKRKESPEIHYYYYKIVRNILFGFNTLAWPIVCLSLFRDNVMEVMYAYVWSIIQLVLFVIISCMRFSIWCAGSDNDNASEV